MRHLLLIITRNTKNGSKPLNLFFIKSYVSTGAFNTYCESLQIIMLGVCFVHKNGKMSKQLLLSGSTNTSREIVAVENILVAKKIQFAIPKGKYISVDACCISNLQI